MSAAEWREDRSADRKGESMGSIRKERGIMIALDVEDEAEALRLAESVSELEGNFVLKVGRPLEMQSGIGVIARIREVCPLPVVYDGKIADIPYISARIADLAYRAGADAVIVQGFVGLDSLAEVAALGSGDVIAVVSMTHPGSAEFIDRHAADLAPRLRALGVNGAVLPATKPDIVRAVHRQLGPEVYVISPGVKAQGAEPGDAVRAGADYEVVGRAIYGAPDPRDAALRLYDRIIRVR
jgi:orotidine-5'-phosphate decarboxylase